MRSVWHNKRQVRENDPKPTKYQFSASERYAVFTVHGDRCYLSGEYLTLKTMEIDHILPEHLLEDPARLAEVLKEYALPADFDLQTYSNWKPACKKCNSDKRSHVFRPTPMIQKHLDDAIAKAPDCQKQANRRVTDNRVAAAWNTIIRADESGDLSDDLRNAIVEFSTFYFRVSPVATTAVPEMGSREHPLRLTPLIQVIRQGEGFDIVKGPYGIGLAHAGATAGGPTSCGACGGTAFNGARCITCGNLYDD